MATETNPARTVDQAVTEYLAQVALVDSPLKTDFLLACAERQIREVLTANAQAAQSKAGRLLRKNDIVHLRNRGSKDAQPGSTERNLWVAGEVGLLDWRGLMMDHAAA